MRSNISDKPCSVGFFKTASQADQAVRELQAAGFSKNELAVICPEQFKGQLTSDAKKAQAPGSHGTEAIVEGGAAGAAIGGIALVATSIATGGAALVPALSVLIGGGAFAGAFSSLILADGYGKGVGEYYDEAVHEGKIVVGVELEGDDSDLRLAEAEGILTKAGASISRSRTN